MGRYDRKVRVPNKGDTASFSTTLARRTRWLLSRVASRHYDFVPNGLTRLPDGFEEFFPTMEKGRPFNALVPHTGRWDTRYPEVGWCTLEEATILHNYGLRFAGAEALEVGSWVGWSTLALGLAGVRLTVVDPVLQAAPQAESLKAALGRAGLAGSVELVAGRSPSAVEALREAARSWCLIFIDGEHSGDAPLRDAQACSAAAGSTAVMILHDAVQENVCEALGWLQDHGWSCGIHRTAQLLAVAWRGEATPIHHRSDSLIPWDWLVRREWPHCAKFQVV
jgi:hypothetical protein